MILQEIFGSRNPWMWGKCYDFALALSEKMPESEFVSIGNPDYPQHVGLMKNGKYYDCRGEMDEKHFRDYHEGPITIIPREIVELHAGVAGMKAPYKGNKDIQAARKAVNQMFK